MEDSQCEPCKARDKNITPTHWCVICEEALCLECTEHHRVQKMSRSHEVLDIGMRPKHMNISDQRCSKHENLPFEYFCIEHDSLCCKECQIESHRSCQRIMSVDIASNGIKRSQSFIDAIELIEHVSMTIPTITEDSHTLIESIEKEANLVEDEIMKVKEVAISHIKYLAKSLLDDLKLKKDKIVTNAKGTINEIEHIEELTQDKRDLFDMVVKHGSEKQVFLAVHANKTVLTDLEERICTIIEKTIHTSMKLNSDILEKNITSIGTIETTEVPTSTKFFKRKKRQSQIPIVHRQDLPFRFVKVNELHVSGVVGGIAVNEKNELVICDNTEKFKYKIDPVFRPTQIAFIPDKNIRIMTVSLDAIQFVHFTTREPMNNHLLAGLQFVDFTTREPMNKVFIKGCQGGGVAASNENIFVGTKGNIKVLDLEGGIIRSIKMKNNKLKPRYIVLDKSGNIYHSDTKVVCCTTIDGKNMFTYKPRDDKMLHGVAIDSQGYIYIVVQNQGVHRLRPDGTFNDLVHTLNEDLKGPFIDICFNKDCTKLYISYEKGVLVYSRQ